MTTQTFTDGVTQSQASWASDVDTSTYSALTALAGQNTLTATGPASMTAYAVGQAFRFLPVSTNTVSTTLNITANSVSLGAKNIFFNGAQLSGGEIVAGTPTQVVYDGTRFQITGPNIGTRLSSAISGNVALSTTANYFTGPNVSTGAVGTWFVTGNVTLADTAGAADVYAKLWDGTNVIATCRGTVPSGTNDAAMSLSGFITNPTGGQVRISCRDSTTTNGAILFNASGTSTDSILFALRVA